MDESNNMLDSPAFLLVTEKLNGIEISSYRLEVRSNPQEIHATWGISNREVNTEIIIVAAKQGYENSDEYVFVITDQTPDVGILFSHTFQLNLKSSSKISDSEHQIDAFGQTFTINTKSTSDIQKIEFNEVENTLFVILSGDAISGVTDMTIPLSLIKPPFSVLLDNAIIFPSLEKNPLNSILHLTYTNGQHNIVIISTPEKENEIETPTTFDVSDDDTIQSDSNDGGCLIATATYGSELAPQVQQLRELRDNSLLQTESGTAFMSAFNDFYYSFSPIIADYERENSVFKEAVKLAITPMISSLSILNYVNMDSEAEVLGYGISLILLNIGMYVGIPASVIVGIRKKF